MCSADAIYCASGARCWLAKVGMLLSVHLAVMCLRPVIESFRIRGEVQLERRALSLYGDKWLGMWTPHDEAINGLKATLDLSLSFVKKLVPRERIFMSDNLLEESGKKKDQGDKKGSDELFMGAVYLSEIA